MPPSSCSTALSGDSTAGCADGSQSGAITLPRGCPDKYKRSSVDEARETSVGLVWRVGIDDIVKRSQQSRCRIEQVRMSSKDVRRMIMARDSHDGWLQES